MDGFAPLLLFLVFALVVAGVAYYSYQLKLQRQREMRALAFGQRLDFSLDDPFGTLGEPFSLFQKGDGRGVENVMWGSWQGLEIRVFDYWYYEESTDSKGHRSKSYSRFDCLITTVDASCPRLQISEENVFTRLADALTFRDIEFESEEFNRRFTVKGPDERFATAFCDARMMQWLLRHGEGYAFEVVGDRLLCWTRAGVAGRDGPPAGDGQDVPGADPGRRALLVSEVGRLPPTVERERTGKEPTWKSSGSCWGSSCVLVLAGVVMYNRFVSQKNLIRDAWANIDTELRRRYDLIPNIVETVKGYAAHEREVLENVTRARAMATGATGSPGRAGGGGGPARRRPPAAVRGRRELSGSQGQPELPRAAGGAHQHRGPAADRSALLQRERARLQPAGAVRPVERRSRTCSTSRKRSSSRWRRPCAATRGCRG